MDTLKVGPGIYKILRDKNIKKVQGSVMVTDAPYQGHAELIEKSCNFFTYVRRLGLVITWARGGWG